MVLRDDVFILHAMRPMFLIRAIRATPGNYAFSSYTLPEDVAVSLSVPASEPGPTAEIWILVVQQTPETTVDASISQKLDRAARWFRSYRKTYPTGHHVDTGRD